MSLHTDDEREYLEIDVLQRIYKNTLLVQKPRTVRSSVPACLLLSQYDSAHLRLISPALRCFVHQVKHLWRWKVGVFQFPLFLRLSDPIFTKEINEGIRSRDISVTIHNSIYRRREAVESSGKVMRSRRCKSSKEGEKTLFVLPLVCNLILKYEPHCFMAVKK